ncbi:MAG TPA: toll/interleukin-1 receptor domain-containing protein [Vicinamibacterales bacterium]|nr:toll/interleukin-1 receptor domain-containing protein [Vicinamibacterales bacterium]
MSIAGPDRAATHTAAKDAAHVFVSFASEDIELARRAVHSLERAGFRCWLSERDIEPAASYPGAITDALARSGALLLILTESANASPHVLREIELAFNARIPILPDSVVRGSALFRSRLLPVHDTVARRRVRS